jgi:hypothetical protein
MYLEHHFSRDLEEVRKYWWYLTSVKMPIVASVTIYTCSESREVSLFRADAHCVSLAAKSALSGACINFYLFWVSCTRKWNVYK